MHRKILFTFVLMIFIVSLLFSLSACNTKDDSNIDIKFKDFIEIENNKYQYNVSNNVEYINIGDYIEVGKGALWNVSSDISGKDVIPSNTIELKVGDNTCYVYVKNEAGFSKIVQLNIRRKPMYTVSIVYNNSEPNDSLQIEEGSSIGNLDEPTKSGYTFSGWSYALDKPITKDKTIDALWTANEYTLTYDVNGGTLSKTSDKVTFDLAYTLPTPTRTCYVFNGWYDGEIRITDGYWTYAGDKTIKAQWICEEYTISYDLDGGTGLNPIQYNIESETLALEDPTKTGYTFVGWTYDGQITPLKDVTIEKGSAGNRAYTANWIANAYTITYDVNGGNALDDNIQEVYYATQYTLITPTRVGYTFAGWYNDDVLIQDGCWELAENVVLVAKWTPNKDTKYTVNHYKQNLDNSYVVADVETLYGETNSTVTPSVKDYLGFSSPSTESIIIKFDGSSVVNYYYVRNTYTIHYVTNGGTIVNDETYKYQEKITLPTTQRKDRSFERWYANIDLNKDVPTSMPAQNVNFYAYWHGETKPCDFKYTNSDICTITKYIGKGNIVRIPNYIDNKKVAVIGENAFRNTPITNIAIPASVTDIGYNAFEECSSLITADIVDMSAWCKILFGNVSANPLSYAHNLYLNDVLVTNLDIPDGTININGYAFNGCSSIKTIKIPSSVTNIFGHTFENCSSITSITIPKNVTNVYDRAFASCHLLESIVLQEGVGIIGDGVFTDCTALTNVNIPNSVASIGMEAFMNCSSLTSISIPSSIKKIGNSAFDGCNNINNATIPTTAVDIIPKTSLTAITINGGEELIDSPFKGNNKLEEVTILSGITKIWPQAFVDCSSLRSVILGEGSNATGIGEHAFSNCQSLESVTLSNSVQNIGYNAFNSCSSLTSIVLPRSIKSIGDRAFAGCVVLTIYSEATSKTADWGVDWNIDNCPVVWYGCDGNNYTYTFDSKQGTSVEPITSKGIIDITSIKPTREGYTFAGWYDNDAYTGSPAAPYYYKKGGTTLYAKWTPNA